MKYARLQGRRVLAERDPVEGSSLQSNRQSLTDKAIFKILSSVAGREGAFYFENINRSASKRIQGG